MSVTTSGSYTYGETLTYQVTVAPGSAGNYVAPPTGGSINVDVNGTTLVCTVPSLTPVGTSDTSTGSCSSSDLPSGSDTLSASYPGDSNYASSMGTSPVTTGLAATTVTVSPSSGSSTYGQSVSYQVSVTASATGTAAASPGGTVSVVVSGATVCTATLTSAPNTNTTTGSCTSPNAAVGADSVTVSYSGDTNFSSSGSSISSTLTVAEAPTTTSVTVSPSGSYTYGESLTYTVTVTAPSDGTYQSLPSGDATLTINGVGFCTSSLTPATSNPYTWTTSCEATTDTPAGTDTLSVSYPGDSNFQPSSHSETATVAKASTSMSVTFGPSTIGYGTGVTYSVTVQPGSSVNLANSENYPTGDVDIFVGPANGVGDVEVCQAPLDPGLFQGTCVGTTAPVGSDTVTATYDGDPNFDGSAPFTAATKLTVNKGSQTISFSPPSSGTVGDTVALSATATSGDPVAFSVDPSSGAEVCSVFGSDGSMVHFSSEGTCVIDANQPGDANYFAAPQVSQYISVSLSSGDGGPGGGSLPENPVLPNAAPPAGLPAGDFVTPISWTIESGVAPTVVHSIDGAKISVTIPTGALPDGTTVSLYPVADTSPIAKSLPAGKAYLLSFALSWEEGDGSVPVASQPVSVTIVDPGIAVGDVIYEVTSTGIKPVVKANENGQLTVEFEDDPALLISSNPKIRVANSQFVLNKGTLPLTLDCSAVGCRGTATVEEQVVVPAKSGSRTKTTKEEVQLTHASFKFGKSKKLTLRLSLAALDRSLVAQAAIHPIPAILKVTVNGGLSITKTVSIS